MLAYLRSLTAPRLLLWCYLVWYLYAAIRYFDPSVRLWASSLGMSVVIGTGLYVSTAYTGSGWKRLGFWPVFRFYLMPFCVSSFAALIKGQEFVFIFHPRWEDNVRALSICGGLGVLATGARRVRPAVPT